ncbi:hypothetical protein PsYK624_122630 [Phanerochaete sordida]|uniref:Uncharacterized protein n=1 Tax=Phanerochaete sordida TaxID=48140 RepID=A0A9P3LI74_9APHY|nr:hypothetical protein PsYK624_122630 [Phanerochaete sordida]
MWISNVINDRGADALDPQLDPQHHARMPYAVMYAALRIREPMLTMCSNDLVVPNGSHGGAVLGERARWGVEELGDAARQRRTLVLPGRRAHRTAFWRRGARARGRQATWTTLRCGCTHAREVHGLRIGGLGAAATVGEVWQLRLLCRA